MAVRAFGYGIDNGEKGPGKAVSYAVKYALLKTFCLETGDDPDRDAGTEHVPSTSTIDGALAQATRSRRIKRINVLVNQLGEHSREILRNLYPDGTKGMDDEELDELEQRINKILTNKQAEQVPAKEARAP